LSPNSSARYRSFDRISPRIREGRGFGADDCPAIQFDAEFAAGDSANFHNRHIVLCRNLSHSSKIFGGN
jgi:hypothetical protein